MVNFVPKNPDFENRAQKIFNGMNFMNFLGITLDLVEPGICEMSIPFSENFTQQHGYFHAGIFATLADNSAGLAAATLLPPDKNILTVEYKMNILRPGKGQKLLARGEVIKAGRTLCVAKSDVFAISAGKKIHCSICQATLLYLDK